HQDAEPYGIDAEIEQHGRHDRHHHEDDLDEIEEEAEDEHDDHHGDHRARRAAGQRAQKPVHRLLPSKAAEDQGEEGGADQDHEHHGGDLHGAAADLGERPAAHEPPQAGHDAPGDPGAKDEGDADRDAVRVRDLVPGDPQIEQAG